MIVNTSPPPGRRCPGRRSKRERSQSALHKCIAIQNAMPFRNTRTPVNARGAGSLQDHSFVQQSPGLNTSSFGTDIHNVEWRVTKAFGARCKTYPLCNSERQLPQKASGGSQPKADLGLLLH